ncbi:MAG TPA: patatin-like phospholipase family protein [Polyangiales bacterium]|nr:patatin-like phospholipase family protein [Polyangiales bacterium]
MTRELPCQYEPGRQRKRVLYVGSGQRCFESLVRDMSVGHGVEHVESEVYPALRLRKREVELIPVWDTRGATASLRSDYVNLLLIDLRWCENFEDRVAEIRKLLKEIDHAEDVEQRYGFHRIVALVSGPDASRIDDLIIELGATGVRHVLRQDFVPDARPWSSDPEFAERVLRYAVDLTVSRRIGKTAICASGGGITGIYFEMGALKCLDDCITNCSVNDFDMMFGISAGAVVTSLLAVGYTTDELMAAIAGVPGGRVPPLSLSLLRLSHFNHEDMRWRLKSAARTGARAFWETLRGGGDETADKLFLEYTSLVGAPFHSSEFEVMLRRLLLLSGSGNDFRKLPTELYVGASDQDARSHVLFGAEGYDHVPISKTVQASLSVNPAFASVPIEGRYYEDGAITRTSNFIEAIQRNATLIFTLDPFVPYVSKLPGVAHRRGVLYNIDQDIRTISFTRFERARDAALRKNPEVSSYTFLPSNTLRRLLSTNPMDHRPYLEIWRGSYLSALKRIDQLCHRLRGDLAEQGMLLDTTKAELVAEQLRKTAKLSFEDFFADRQVDIRKRPFMQPSQLPPPPVRATAR